MGLLIYFIICNFHFQLPKSSRMLGGFVILGDFLIEMGLLYAFYYL